MSDQHLHDPREPLDQIVRLTWLGHPTVVIELGGVRLITDPLLRRRIGALVRPSTSPAQRHSRGVDAVLLSHLHHDHADVPSLRRLGRTPVVTGPANRPWVTRLALDIADVTEGMWWTVAPSGPGGLVEVRLVRAVHHSRRMPHRPNDTHGFLVRSPDAVVWFAGDTEFYPEMSNLPMLAGRPIDIAVLPIGGWGPALSSGHLGPRTAAEAAAASGALAVMPVHYGTLHPLGWPRQLRGWMHEPLRLFAEELHERAPGTTLHSAPFGVAVDLPPAADGLQLSRLGAGSR